ncbi:hypothetical protein OQA88_12345 [Cercophora sp. LCS_1]
MFTSWYTPTPTDLKFTLHFQVLSDPSHIPTPSHLTTFHLFPFLPPELRLEIWSCLLQPRIVLAALLDSRTSSTKSQSLFSNRPSLPRIPILLHINRETRALALRHYELTFAWKLPPRLASPEAGALPSSGPARVWFNFGKDGLLLMGELEPFDQYGFNSPMVYFLRKEDTARVRHVGVAYEELRMGDYESEQVFGALFHVVDRFPSAERLLVTTTERDVETRGVVLPARENVVQKVWRAWISGSSIVTSSLAKKEILLIAEDGMAGFISG